MVVALVLFILAAVQYGPGGDPDSLGNATSPVHYWAAAILAALSVMTVIVLIGVAAVRYQVAPRAD